MTPRIVQAELWQVIPDSDMIVVSTNGSISKDGTLVMGRGAALQARRHHPGIERECARSIQTSIESTRSVCGSWVYGFLVVRQPMHRQPGFGIFQVKRIWTETASLKLLSLSVAMLNRYARLCPERSIRMNYPGIGNGGLRRDSVEPLLACLPENVTICYR